MIKPSPDLMEALPIEADKEKSRSLLVTVGLIVVVIGCVVVVSVMSEEGWSRDPATQHRVAILATVLLLTSLALCYFAMRSYKIEESEERRTIVLVRPRGYSSMKSTEHQPYWMTNCVLVSTMDERESNRLAAVQDDLIGILTREEIPRVHGVQANG